MLERAFSATSGKLTGLIVAVLLLSGLTAEAHQRSLSYSRWTIGEKTARVEFRVTELELTRFPAGIFAPEYLSSRLVLYRDGAPLVPGPIIRRSNSAKGWAVFEWEIEHGGLGGLTIRNDAFLDIISTHQHFVRVQYAARPDTPPVERLLTENQREWTLGVRLTGSGFSDYLALGVEHILGGWDHLAFVLVLLLMATALREVAVLVTGFTIAHSITLALAVLDVVRPEIPVVEIYIAFSIALIAVENFWWSGRQDRAAPLLLTAGLLVAGLIAMAGRGTIPPVAWAGLILFTFAYFAMLQEAARPFQLRAIVTFAFGLVHGFGFAGVLMDLGLPPGRTALGLFGFNLGVEAGQLFVVALCWPVLVVLRRIRSGTLYPPFAEAGSAVALCLAVYWLVTRNWAS